MEILATQPAIDNGVADLAESLGVSESSLERLGVARNGRGWKYPERDADGAVVGSTTRYPNGDKLAEKGGKRGLVYDCPLRPADGSTEDDPTLIVEGLTVAAAGLDLDFVVVGRPSATGGLAYLQSLLDDRHVCIVGENDDAGRNGAEKIAAGLHEVCRSVRIIYPLDGAKDLRQWMCAPAGCDRAEVISAIRAAEPFESQQVVSLADARPKGLTFNLTDLGNAERLHARHGGKIRYSHQRGKWLRWCETHWTPDENGLIQSLAADTVRTIYAEASVAQDEVERRAIAKWAATSENRYRIEAAVALAKGIQDLTVTADQLDADAWLFNVQNGTLDLRTGELRPHQQADLITKLAPVEYDADAKGEIWSAFIDRIFNGDTDLIDWVQRWFGYCLTGDVAEQYFPICWGSGANGKSTLLDALVRLMGDYAGNAPGDMLTQRMHDEHPCELAALMGKRLVVTSESEKGRRLKVELMKRLTGETTITARFMKQNFFTFERQFKIVMATNNKPRVDEDSEAAWRRLRLIPFTQTIPPAEQDKRLLEKLDAERAAILAWLVEGCLEWQRNGLSEADAVTTATGGYREESDPLRDFLDECCLVQADAWTETASLRELYEGWCKQNGDRPLGSRNFADALRRHGCTAERLHSGRGWRGVGLPVPPGVTRDTS